MYHSTGVQTLSETQKSKLRNGHPVRIKKGSGNNLHLTDDQIKKLESAAKKGPAYTPTMHRAGNGRPCPVSGTARTCAPRSGHGGE